MSGVSYNFGITGRYGRVSLLIERSVPEENRLVFDRLLERKEQIEADFGEPLVWEALEGRQRCEIKAEIEADVFEREDWPRMIAFMSDAMVRLERAFQDPLRQIGAGLKAKGQAGKSADGFGV